MSDKRKIGIVSVMSQELVRATDDAAETLVTGTLQRALSRGLDDAFLGSKPRSNISPPGIGTITTKATGFNAGIEAFTGDLTAAAVILNPLTAVSLRSPTETQITANGGIYGGLPAITSYAVPADTLFIVDGSRVLAFIGDAQVHSYSQGDLYGLAGASPTVPVSLFQTNQVAFAAGQYADWAFVDGAAVEVTLSAGVASDANASPEA